MPFCNGGLLLVECGGAGIHPPGGFGVPSGIAGVVSGTLVCVLPGDPDPVLGYGSGSWDGGLAGKVVGGSGLGALCRLRP